MSKKESILVTGSEGRIGRILVPALSEDFEVYGLDHAARPGAASSGVLRMDLSDYDLLEKTLLKLGRLKSVIHLAGQRHISDHWDLVQKNVIVATRNVYECARATGISKVIYASSNQITEGYEKDIAETDSQQPPLLSTSEPIRPTSNYATCKAFAEALARQYWEVHGVKSVCLRIGTVRSDDNPLSDPTGRWMRTWLSHRDLIQLVRKSISADVDFGVYYGVSNNAGRFWDISNAEADLGYVPVDDSALLRNV